MANAFSYHSKTVKAGISTCAYFGTPFINKLLFTMQYLDKKRRNLKLTIYIDILLSPLLTWWITSKSEFVINYTEIKFCNLNIKLINIKDFRFPDSSKVRAFDYFE